MEETIWLLMDLHEYDAIDAAISLAQEINDSQGIVHAPTFADIYHCVRLICQTVGVDTPPPSRISSAIYKSKNGK